MVGFLYRYLFPWTFSKEVWLSGDNGGKTLLRGCRISPRQNKHLRLLFLPCAWFSTLSFFSTKGRKYNRKAMKVKDNGYYYRYPRDISSWRYLQMELLGNVSALDKQDLFREDNPDWHFPHHIEWNTSIPCKVNRHNLRKRQGSQVFGRLQLNTYLSDIHKKCHTDLLKWASSVTSFNSVFANYLILKSS